MALIEEFFNGAVQTADAIKARIYNFKVVIIAKYINTHLKLPFGALREALTPIEFPKGRLEEYMSVSKIEEG